MIVWINSIWNERKINLDTEKWYAKQQCLSTEYEWWACDCLPCPISSAANDDSYSSVSKATFQVTLSRPVPPGFLPPPFPNSTCSWDRFFYGSDALPVTQPTVSRHWTEQTTLQQSSSSTPTELRKTDITTATLLTHLQLSAKQRSATWCCT